MTTACGEIARLIPHSGAMCLLRQVLAWDDAHIVCGAASHRDNSNPLLDEGRLWAFCGIEYAAQAMAAHRALTVQSVDAASDKATYGLLASVRDLVLHADRLDDVDGDLIVRADKLIAEGERLLYQFTVSSENYTLVGGRLAVVLRQNAKPAAAHR